MNWLMYIGGALIFTELVVRFSHYGYIKCKKEWTVVHSHTVDFFSLMVWIWICWRFIK